MKQSLAWFVAMCLLLSQGAHLRQEMTQPSSNFKLATSSNDMYTIFRSEWMALKDFYDQLNGSYWEYEDSNVTKWNFTHFADDPVCNWTHVQCNCSSSKW